MCQQTALENARGGDRQVERRSRPVMAEQLGFELMHPYARKIDCRYLAMAAAKM